MAKSIETNPNAPLLVWARESIGYSVPEVADRMGVPASVLVAWEQGNARPTAAQLRKLAGIYKRPLAIFYLPAPPQAFDAMRYFRRHPGEQKPDPSPGLAVQIRDAEARREIALELATMLGETVPRLPLRASIGDRPNDWAWKAREWLGVTIAQQTTWKNEYEGYRSWRGALERAGVLVLQVTRCGDEVRGFSIDADVLPVIAASSKDPPRARIFTLFHELGHLILGTGELDEGAWSMTTTVETFCNEFAGEFLVPSAALEAELRGQPPGRRPTVDAALVARLVNRFWVSEHVVLLRLVTAGRLTRAAYESRRAELESLPRKQGGFVEYPTQKVQALGRPFVRSVLAAYYNDQITANDVADYLGIRLKHLPAIERLVTSRQADAGEASA